MKLYLCINKQPINGYTHIDPMPKGDVPAFTDSIDKITEVCDRAECEELLAPDMLDYISHSQIDNVLDIMVSLLRHNGVIILGGNDAHELCRLVFLGAIDSEVINNSLYGGDFRKNGLHDISSIKKRLTDKGLEILNIKLDSGKFLIKAKRP